MSETETRHGMLTADDNLRRWTRLCSACDAGMGACSCPRDDPRPLVKQLWHERDDARAELSRLRGVVEAVQAAVEREIRHMTSVPYPLREDREAVAADLRAAVAAALAPVSSSGEAGCPDCGGSGVVQEAHDGGTHPVHCRCTYAAPSSGEAESGEAGKPYDPARWCRHPECKDTNWGGWGRVHLRDSNCPPDLEGKYLDRQPQDPPPAPVPSGGQADGEGVRLTEAEREALGDVWDEDTTVSVSAFYPVVARIIAARLAARPVLSREALRAKIDPLVDGFIRDWVPPTMQGHLLDDDDNSGEWLREALADVLAGGEQA